MKTAFSTEINQWQFRDTQDIKRTELTQTCRRYIREMQVALEKTCRRIWLAKNANSEAFLFGKFTANEDGTIVTLAAYNPHVGWITQQS